MNGKNVHGQPFLTERRKSYIQILDANCPAETEQAEGSLMDQMLELEESIGLWGDMLDDAINDLEMAETKAKEDSIKEDIRMIRAHIQECKVMMRTIKMEVKKAQKDVFESGEQNNTKEQLTA